MVDSDSNYTNLSTWKQLLVIFSPPNVLKSEANGFHCCQIHNFAIITKRSSPAVDAVPECGSHFAKCSSACSVDSTVWSEMFMWCVTVCCVACRSDQSSQITVHSLVWADRSAFCIVAEMHFVQYTAHSGRKLPRFPASLAIISISAQSVANPTICLFSNLVCAWQCRAHGSAVQYKVYNAI